MILARSLDVLAWFLFFETERGDIITPHFTHFKEYLRAHYVGEPPQGRKQYVPSEGLLLGGVRGGERASSKVHILITVVIFKKLILGRIR